MRRPPCSTTTVLMSSSTGKEVATPSRSRPRLACSTPGGVERGWFLAQVCAATFRPRAELATLFVAVNIGVGAVNQAGLVVSGVFDHVAGVRNSRGRLRLAAPIKPGSKV